MASSENDSGGSYFNFSNRLKIGCNLNCT